MHETKARLERPTTVIHVEDRAGVTHAIEPVEGWRLMEILRDYGLAMENTCGGALACAECHVLIDPNGSPRFRRLGRTNWKSSTNCR